jgi:hypothetical protein
VTESPSHRVTSGVVQGATWPGYYFTGQDAISTGEKLNLIAAAIERGRVDPRCAKILRDLADRLQSCEV